MTTYNDYNYQPTEEDNAIIRANESVLLTRESQNENNFGFFDSLGYAVGSSVLSAGAQLADIPASINNMLGGDAELINKEALVADVMGGNAAEYYLDNKDVIDTVGFVASSFVPGTIGIKVLQAVQKGVTAVGAAKNIHPYYNLALRTLNPRPELAYQAVKGRAVMDRAAKIATADGFKAMAANSQQWILEGAAFEIATMATMSNGEVLDEMSAMDMVQNSLLGVGIGGVLGTGAGALKVWGHGKKAIKETTPVWNKFSLPKVVTETSADPAFTAALHMNALKVLPTLNKASKEFAISADAELNSGFVNMLEGNQQTKVINYHEAEAVKALVDITKGDVEAATLLKARLSELEGDELVEEVLGLQSVTSVASPTKTESKIRILLKGENALDEANILEAQNLQIKYGDPLLGTKGATNSAPDYISLQDLPKGKVKVKGNKVIAGKDTYDVTSNLEMDVPFHYLSPREHEARALWMESKPGKYFAKAKSIHEEDFGALDVITAKLLRGEFKPDMFKNSTLKIRTIDGKIKEWNLNSQLNELVQAHVDNKYKVISKARDSGLPLPGSTIKAKAQALRDITGVPFEVNARKVGAADAHAYRSEDQAVTYGNIRLSSRVFKEQSLRQLVQTTLHEVGHLQDFAKRSNLGVGEQRAKLTDPALEKELTKLSKQARPKLWASKSKADKQYRELTTELMADARMMLATMSKEERDNYPAIMNSIGKTVPMISEQLRRYVGFNLDKPTSLTALARAANIDENSLLHPRETGYVQPSVAAAFHREARLAAANNTKLKSAFDLPFYQKYEYNKSAVPIDANEVRGAAKLAIIQQLRTAEQESVASSVLTQTSKEVADLLPSQEGEMLSATSSVDALGSGAGALTASNKDYGNLGSFTKWIGGVTTKLKEKAVTKIEADFDFAKARFIEDPELARGWSLLNAKVRATPGHFVLDKDNMQLVGKVDEQEVFKLSDFVSTKEQAKDLLEVVEMHIAKNGARLSNNAKLNLVLHGKNTGATELSDTFYPIPVNRKDKPFHAFVFDDRIASGRSHSHMLYANSQEELTRMQHAISSDPVLGRHISFKSNEEIAEYYESTKEFEMAKMVTNKNFSSDLQRRGLDAPMYAETDPKRILENLLNFHANGEKATINHAIEAKYSRTISALKVASAKATTAAVGTSKTTVKDPYMTYIAEMRGESNISNYQWWAKASDTLNSVFDSLHNDVFANLKGGTVTESELLEINKQLKKAGFENAFVSPMVVDLVNKGVERETATRHVGMLNSLMSYYVLRTDPLHAMNNLIGHNVMMTAEITDLLELIKKRSPESGLLSKLYLDLPGEATDTVLNQTKLVSEAIGEFFSREDLRQLYRDAGFVMDVSDQLKQLLGEAAIGKVETTAGRIAKSKELASKAGTLMEKASLNHFSEEMTNFVSARVMHKIAEAAVEAGVLSKDSIWPYVNTFVGRVRGTYIASQRPAMLQGPIGMSMGLFQTYQLNLMQQLFRYASEGRAKSIKYMMGLQGSIYGLNGLPLYDVLNTKIVGDLEGNTNNQDITQSVYDLFGTKGADWIVYGAASNFLTMFHKDLGTNIYTRGDLNPRQATIVPVNPMDAPWVQGWTKFFTNLYNTGEQLASGAPVGTTIARGIEHNGLSRPLSGLGKWLEGFTNEDNKAYSTTKAGGLLASYDMMSIASLVGVLGGRTLTEARSLDALYRLKAYDMDKNQTIAKFKQSLRAHTVNKTTISKEDYLKFMEDYVAMGGDQARFRSVLLSAMKDANESSINQIREINRSDLGRDLQVLMGGDFRSMHPGQ